MFLFIALCLNTNAQIPSRQPLIQMIKHLETGNTKNRPFYTGL